MEKKTQPASKSKFDLKYEASRLLLCTAASLIISLNINSFVHAGGLLPGGFSGLALLLIQVLKDTRGITLTFGPVYIAMNAFPVILSFLQLGKKFTAYSCYTIVMVSFLTGIMPSYPITYDILLVSIFGGIISGFASCLCLFARATGGGTDFISIYVTEKMGFDGWLVVLIFNAVVLSVDGLIYGWDKALYSIIFQYVAMQVIHTLYKRYKKNTLFIVTSHSEQVTELISKTTGHGATAIMAVGTHENRPITLVYSVVGSEDLPMLTKSLQEVDPQAFVNVIRTEQLNGRFYMRPND